MEKEVVTITLAELSQMLRDEKTYRGTVFIGFDALTEPDMYAKLEDPANASKKIPNPHRDRVLKQHLGQVAMIFGNKTTNAYQNAVRRRNVLEGLPGDFEVKPPSWGTRIPNTSMYEHTPKETGEHTEYLQLIYCERPVGLVEYAERELGIELSENDRAAIDGMDRKVVAFETMHGSISYLIDGQPIAKDQILGLKDTKNEGSQGGASEGMKVIVRSFKLRNIKRISMNKKDYVVEN